MKLNRKTYMCMVVLLAVSLCTASTGGVAEAREECGVILIAHGSVNPGWNQQVLNLYGKIRPKLTTLPVISRFSEPVEVAFLRYGNKKTFKNATDTLKKRDKKNILLVHLSPSSYSIRHDEIVSVAKKTDTGAKPWMNEMPGITPAGLSTLQFSISPAMDDHPLAVEILKEYAEALSRDPKNECLMLLGYGAVDELENIVWVRQLERIGKKIEKELGLRETAGMTLRYHSADLIREQAIVDLRRAARRLQKQGRVIVVPYVLCEGIFQQDLKSYLQGIVPPEDICMKGVISHPNTKKWVEEVIKRGMEQPEVGSVNRNWSVMDAMKGKPAGTHKYGLVGE